MHISEATKFKRDSIETRRHTFDSNWCKYLGVTLQSDLKWNCHVEEKVAKANQILAMIWRNVCVASATTRELAYNRLVRPQLEYASVVWLPWQTYLEDAIEKVQRRAACYVCNKYSMVSVTSLINDLKWDTLKLHRIKSSLCIMHKIHHGLVKFPLYQYASPSMITHTRKSHQHKIYPLSANKNSFYYSFLPQTTPLWNNLPPNLINQSSLNHFRTLLDNIDFD